MLIETEGDRVSLFSVATSLIPLLITTSLREGATASCITIPIDTMTSLTSISIDTDWVMSSGVHCASMVLSVNARCLYGHRKGATRVYCDELPSTLKQPSIQQLNLLEMAHFLSCTLTLVYRGSPSPCRRKILGD